MLLLKKLRTPNCMALYSLLSQYVLIGSLFCGLRLPQAEHQHAFSLLSERSLLAASVRSAPQQACRSSAAQRNSIAMRANSGSSTAALHRM